MFTGNRRKKNFCKSPRTEQSRAEQSCYQDLVDQRDLIILWGHANSDGATFQQISEQFFLQKQKYQNTGACL